MKRFNRLVVFLLAISSLALAREKYQKAGPVKLSHDGQKWAEKTLKKMSLEEKIGQMLQVRYYMDFENVDNPEYKEIRDQIKKYHIGSVILTVRVDGGLLLKDLPLEAAAITNQMQRDSKYPLIFAADFERGLSMRMNSVPLFPHAMAFGAAGNLDYAERFGAITAKESRAVGIQWNFFPDADVNINPANPIINTRSFGEDPQQVGDLTAAYIKGSKAHGMLTTAKHFPGHGDTSSDSHLGVARVGGDLARIQSVELPPFKKAIDAGVDSIMIAHVTIPALEPDPNKVATTSQKIVTDVLKNQLGFKGLIVTDAMEMHGLTRLYPPGQGNPSGRAAVDAVKAGNDMILLPSDLDGAYNGMLQAVKSGEIPKSRIDDSVKKILEAKASVGLDKARLVDMEQVSHIVSKPDNMDFAQEVADAAVTLVRDNGQALPLRKIQGTAAANEPYDTPEATSNQVVAIVITDDVRSDMGRIFERALRSRRPDAKIFHVDEKQAAGLTPEILQAVNGAQKVVVAAYIVPTAAKQVMVNGQLTNTVGLEQATGALLRQVLERAGQKTAVIAMGNPYVAQNFPSVQTYICTYSNAASSEVSAVKLLFGELQVHGKLPVTLPGIAQRGFSLPWPRSAEAAAANSAGAHH
ncbi:MAG TPA: glycoside hydrolase family 3 N-terminal domain-containing protein [Terriglobales bacterium]